MALATALIAGTAVLAQAPPPPAKPAQAAPSATTPAPAQAAPSATAPPPAQQQAPRGIATLPITPKEQVKPEDVVMTIGGEKITRARFEAIKNGLPPQYSGVPQQMGDRGFAGAYAQFRGLALEAEKRRLDQSAEFQEQLGFARTELLARLLVSEIGAKSQEVKEEDIKAYYEAHAADFQQAKVRAIFVALSPPAKPAPAAGGAAPKAEAPKAETPKAETPKTRTDEEAKARAEELRKKVLDGADFASVAKENSDHQSTAEKGGDLGTVLKGTLPPNLDSVVFSLKPKEVSAPVKEGQGYYVFQVEEVRPRTLDEASATIRNTLSQQRMNAALEKVKTDYAVTYNDQYFGPATPAAGATRPVITGVAPAQPGSVGTPAPVPAPAAKPAAPPAAKKP